MPSETSQKALEVLATYMPSGAQSYFEGLLKKLGMNIETFNREDLKGLAAMIEKGASIILGAEKADGLMADLAAI